MTVEAKATPQVAVMNAVHDLPVLVARDEGYFKDEGLDLEFVTTPGMAQVTTSHFVKFDSVIALPPTTPIGAARMVPRKAGLPGPAALALAAYR